MVAHIIPTATSFTLRSNWSAFPKFFLFQREAWIKLITKARTRTKLSIKWLWLRDLRWIADGAAVVPSLLMDREELQQPQLWRNCYHPSPNFHSSVRMEWLFQYILKRSSAFWLTLNATYCRQKMSKPLSWFKKRRKFHPSIRIEKYKLKTVQYESKREEKPYWKIAKQAFQLAPWIVVSQLKTVLNDNLTNPIPCLKSNNNK